MIDWHYGFINLLSSVPFILAWISFAHFKSGTWGVIFMIISLISVFLLFNKKSSYQEKYHPTTVNHFDGVFRTILGALALLAIWLIPDFAIDFVLPFIIVAANTVPSFFTKKVEHP
ncbi:hypothetical protein LFYK43_00070 [Ligilactobacillus salitolerans]|uniref:Uncharacterized protein n=1 Tax=Ligilactobacillus salitolerans TaxID=1808352 RepID=A0A401IPU1_9LACO|nr:hypothetical protein [Ligilactobacillus salitolerans]GBG93548.1 hypothetical protein LFYK43_00070 [Ligilactobacillus salitolerans]